MSWTDAAESIMVRCGQLYHAYAEESVAGGEPFAEERAMRVYGQLMTVQKLTWEAGDELFRTASSSGAKDGARMQRYWRDITMYRGHMAMHLEMHAQMAGGIMLELAH
jgi:Acyl-CoA dehydrogenase, C-terminal domain